MNRPEIQSRWERRDRRGHASPTRVKYGVVEPIAETCCAKGQSALLQCNSDALRRRRERTYFRILLASLDSSESSDKSDTTTRLRRSIGGVNVPYCPPSPRDVADAVNACGFG